MKSSVSRTVAAAFLALSLLVSVSPAGAASTYHMNGQGTISIDMGGGGLPACAGLAGNCANPESPQGAPGQQFSWGQLTVQGFGTLANQSVSGNYSCSSEGTLPIPTPLGDRLTSFQSRIAGNTSNFQLTFNFQCLAQAGTTGPAYINGWFSNVTTFPSSSCTPGGSCLGYRNVAGQWPQEVSTGPAIPLFKGYFITSNIHPALIDASNGERMVCNGGFVPNSYDSQNHTIKTAAFLGHCNASQ